MELELIDDRPPLPPRSSSGFDVNSFLKKTFTGAEQDVSPDSDPGSRSRVSRSRSEHDVSGHRRCAYCDDISRTNELYCQDCLELLQNVPEVNRRLIAEQGGHPRHPEDVSSPELSSLLPTATFRQTPQIVEHELPERHRSPSLTSQSSSSRPLCRICQLPGEPRDALISPCRCSGTMQFVHRSCLVHWLEISTRKMCPSPRCELCGYAYRTHHCLKLQKVHTPSNSNRDKGYHIVFVLMLFVMLGCAALSVFYLSHAGQAGHTSAISIDDIVVITCSVLFFLAFFVAVFTQYRSEATLCTMCFRCWVINKHWRIKNYDPVKDKGQDKGWV